jgi:hypothetical protein
MDLRDDRHYPASILDADSQPLSTGKALVRTTQSYAAFWPQPPVDEEKLLKSAAKLQIPAGPCFAIKRIERCLLADSLHYDCHFA